MLAINEKQLYTQELTYSELRNELALNPVTQITVTQGPHKGKYLWVIDTQKFNKKGSYSPIENKFIQYFSELNPQNVKPTLAKYKPYIEITNGRARLPYAPHYLLYRFNGKLEVFGDEWKFEDLEDLVKYITNECLEPVVESLIKGEDVKSIFSND